MDKEVNLHYLPGGVIVMWRDNVKRREGKLIIPSDNLSDWLSLFERGIHDDYNR